MKKRIIALIITMLSLSLTACGNQTITTESEVQTEQTSTESETELKTSSHEEETTETEFIGEIDTSTTDTSTSSEYNDDENEIRNSEWADINGAWDAVHQYTLYAKSQGADGTGGWCWIYFNGKGAGDQPSYAVYMKEGDPLYGTVYHVGDYLPDGTQFSGTNDEWEAFIKQDFERLLTEDGSVSFKDPETGRTIIGTQEEIDAYKASKGYNNNNGGASNNTTSQPAQSSEEQTVSPSGSGDGSGSSRENRSGVTENWGGEGAITGGNLQ